MNNLKAFTLTETLITVVILGIVAAILVPNLINRQVENANRTKVKKAMAAYEKAINYIIIENDIKSTEELKEFGEEENCKFSKAYFKTVQDGTNDCIFKTADRVWWDITNLSNPLISLRNEITPANEETVANNALSLNADTTSFALIGRFDDLGTLRVNDNAYEQELDNNAINQAYMIKLWHFINNMDLNSTDQFTVCKAQGLLTCVISLNGISTKYSRVITTSDTVVDTFSNGSHIDCIYNRNNNPEKTCGYDSIAPAGEYWITDSLGYIKESEAKDMTGSVCTTQGCINNGDYYEAAKRRCQNSGGHLANLAELEIARQNGKLKTGQFWASEELTSYYAFSFNTEGKVYNRSKYESIWRVICVGD